jgi:hypothetical protein
VRIAALIAGLSIEVCDVHDGAVDSAEIEAAYRNGVAALDQLASVESLTRDLGVQIAETRANDDRNRDLILSNADLNRSAIVANDNANRDAIVANDNVNRDVIKAELDALGAAGVERDIMTALGRRECHSWMYTPAWADAARTVFLGGHLETMLLVTRKVIDQARLLGMVSARDLELAERGLAQVSAVAGDRPVPAGAICRDLLQAYRKATSVHP